MRGSSRMRGYMNIIVIGLGSMGKRRIRLLQQYIRRNAVEKEKWEIVGVDLMDSRRQECEDIYRIKTFLTLKEALEYNHFECAVISTAPASHAHIITECLNADLHVFTEINLIKTGYPENLSLAKKQDKVLFLSAMFLYRKEIEYMKKRVGEVSFRGTYQHHTGQYLPDWHPWESYKDYFIGNRKTNGCREILAVELPWLIDTFGAVKAAYSLHRKITELDIDYDDCYQIILEHETGVTGSLIVDVVTPNVTRKIEMWQENFCLSWSGTPETLMEYDHEKKEMAPVAVYAAFDHEKGYNPSIVEDAYYEELVDFFAVINKENTPRYTFEQDEKILDLIDRIEK